MCRWIAYIGSPVYIDTLVTKPPSSLVTQSLHSRMCYRQDGSILSTNGDGFGLGWYSSKEEPGLFKGAEPAWGSENLNEICSQLKAHIFMAHIRAASTGAIQRSNAHPFKYKNWLFQHNGYVNHFETIRRDLQFSIAPELFSALKGTTDSETFFLLALTYGLQENPKEAVERMIARVKQACTDNNVPAEMLLSCALSDGKTLYTWRYSANQNPNTQYYSTYAECMKEMNEDSGTMPAHSVVVVSEPLDHSSDQWQEMPINSFATIRAGVVGIETLQA